jgi:hypothetical protein
MAPKGAKRGGIVIWLIIVAAVLALLVLTPNALGAAIGHVLAEALVTALSAIGGLLGSFLGAN